MKLLGLWVGVAALFGGLLLWAEHSRNRLDDPDPALQRTGFLFPAGAIRQPGVIPGFPRPGHRTVVIFARSVHGRTLFHDLALQSDLSAMADVLLVSADGRAPTITQGLQTIVEDRDGRIAQAFGMSTPLDGGYPVGLGVYSSYRHHDARFHWFVHFFVGASAALLLMAAVAWRTRRPVRWPLLWLLAGHLFAMVPDILFLLFSVIHQRWMDVFLWHISAHFIPGRNVTWYLTFLASLGVYFLALQHVSSGHRRESL